MTAQRSGEEFDDARLYLRLLADTFDSGRLPAPRAAASSSLALAHRARRRQRRRGRRGQPDARRSHGRHTLYGGLAGGSTLSSEPPPELLLGGFLNLSGTVPESLDGRHFALARLVYYRQTGRQALADLRAAADLGASLETGNVWLDRDQAGVDDLVTAGSLFVGLDTFLGPVYLAYGRTDAGEDRWYFALGAPFLSRTGPGRV